MSTRALAAILVLAVGVPLILVQLSNEHGTNSAKAEADAANDKALFAACRGGNLRSAYELANESDGAARHTLAEDVLPIINCDVLISEGRRLAVPLDTQNEYIRIVVEDRRWPVLRDGVIVGTEALPGLAPRQGDEDAEAPTAVLP